jgi:outer membrane immunogenic protein
MLRLFNAQLITPLTALILIFGMAATAKAQSGMPKGSSDWSGLYAGVHAGGGVGKAAGSNTSGVMGGAHAGYNLQLDQFVVGAEADVTASAVDHKGLALKYRQKWTGSFRGRAGVAVDRALIYGTAGIAGAGMQLDDAVVKSSRTETGYVVGAGAELKLSHQVSVRGEFLHYDFGGSRYNSTLGPVEVNATTNVVRGGASLKF